MYLRENKKVLWLFVCLLLSLSLSLSLSFTLVDHRRNLGCLHQPLKLGNGEVGYSNGLHKTALNQFLHCLFNQEHGGESAGGGHRHAS